MADDKIKVRLTVYCDRLCIETQEPFFEETDYWHPINDARIGCVLENTKERLGASQEAIEWLRAVKRSGDAIGDVDWSRTKNGAAFSWMGGVKHIASPGAEGSRTFEVMPDECVIIPNDVPEGAKDFIDFESVKESIKTPILYNGPMVKKEE